MSSDVRRLWMSCAALALMGACVEQRPFGPAPDVIVVHAVLNPAERVQHVVVVRKTAGTGFDRMVSGATVSLVTPDGTTLPAAEVSTTGDPSDFYDGLTPSPRYDISTSVVATGQPYRLLVVLPTGEVVEGETTAPMAVPARSAIARRLDRDVDTLRLSWPRVPGARAYEVRITPARDSMNFYSGGYVTYADTAMTLPASATTRGSPIFIPGFTYDLVVSAVDANYYLYYAFDSDQYTGTALPSSLRGAMGVFGAIVPIVRLSLTVEGTDPLRR